MSGFTILPPEEAAGSQDATSDEDTSTVEEAIDDPEIIEGEIDPELLAELGDEYFDTEEMYLDGSELDEDFEEEEGDEEIDEDDDEDDEGGNYEDLGTLIAVVSSRSYNRC